MGGGVLGVDQKVGLLLPLHPHASAYSRVSRMHVAALVTVHVLHPDTSMVGPAYVWRMETVLFTCSCHDKFWCCRCIGDILETTGGNLNPGCGAERIYRTSTVKL